MLRTKKTLRALAMLTALVMAFSLTSVVAFADTVSVTVDTPVVDDATGKITVTGTISVPDADVTILALRDTAAVEAAALGTMSDTDLEGKIVYINQEAAVDSDYSFSFIPKAGVPGGVITVFVGGEGVETIAVDDVDVKNIAPTLTVADAELTIGDDLVIGLSGLTAEDEAAWADAITEIKVGEETVTGVYDETAHTITVSGLAAGEYANIAITATDHRTASYTGTIKVSLKAAPTLTVAEEIVWSDADVDIEVTGDTAEAWLADETLTITATTGAGDEVAVVCGDGIISLTAADLKPADVENVTVTVSFGGAAEYEAVEDITITVVSPIQNVIDTLVQKPTVDKKTDLAKYSFVIPADAEDGSIVYTVEGQTEKTFDVARTEGAEQTVVVIATITVAGYEPYAYTVETITVKALGDDGPTFTEENISIPAIEGGAYGEEGKAVITITNAEIEEPANTIVKVGETTLFYSPERGKYVGIIDEATAGDLVDSITVEEGTSPVIYYGNVTDPAVEADIANGDVSRALGILKGTFEPSEAQLLAADVLGIGEVTNGSVSRILGVLKGTATKDSFTVIEAAE